MALHNSATNWGSVAKVFHWTLAALILGTSLFVVHINGRMWWFQSNPKIFITYIHWHKSFGMIALTLILARILWTMRQTKPVTALLTPFEERASKWTHRALYTLMVGVPMTGWLASSAFGSKTNFFGLFKIPGIWPKDKLMLSIGYWAHFTLAWVILTLVTFHVGAALYHHIIRRDRVLTAMLPYRE